MDIRPLSATLGHESVRTALNVYTHVNDSMREQTPDALVTEVSRRRTATPQNPPNLRIPDGTRDIRTIYAHREEACGAMPAEMIEKVKGERKQTTTS